VFGDGDQTRDFTFVDDAVAGTIAAAHSGNPGGVYNIGGGSRRSLNSVFDALNAVAGLDVSRVHMTSQAGDARDTAADISRAQRDLGYYPSTSFETGLRRQLEWQRTVLESLEVVGDH
jgi:nucleoside-diphosphate-sugar epimerase